MLPSASCPTPVRGSRSRRLDAVIPLRAEDGLSVADDRAARRRSRRRCLPTEAAGTGGHSSSGRSEPQPRACSPAAPRPTRTAPSGGMGVPPPFLTASTVPRSSVPGTAGGNGWSVTSNVPWAAGVAPPQAGVKSLTLPRTRTLVEAAQRATRASCPATAEHLHLVDHERAVVCDPEARAERMRRCHEDPGLHVHAGRQPLVPREEVTVDACDGGASPETRRCIEVTVSRPSMKPFERTGRSA